MQQQCSTALGVLLLRQMKLTKAELTEPEWSSIAMTLQMLGFTKATESCRQQCSNAHLECTCKLPTLLCAQGTMLYHMPYHIPALQKHRAHLQANSKEGKNQPLGG